jgi:hypothetical protein
MWLILALYVAVALAMIVAAAEIGGALPLLIIVLARFLFATEANSLRRWSLEGRGYRLTDVVEAANLSDAEIRFFAERHAPGPPATPGTARSTGTPALPPPQPRPSPEGGDVIGLFPAPGGRS